MILVLGAGPAGLAAAWQLARRGLPVVVAERGDSAGGLAGSFEWEGQSLDFGSHRLHPSCEPAILADIRGFLGPDLLDRPRHGRIHLMGRWLHFPLATGDILRRAPRAFALGVLRDTLWKPSPAAGNPTFATVLEQGLGATVCRDFYFPYARKIWGLEPEEMDAEQARRRVSAGSIAKLVRKVMAPGAKRRFYYPRGGFGQISEGYAQAAEQSGAQMLYRRPVTGLALEHGRVKSVTLAGERVLEPRLVLSTIPLPRLAALTSPPRQVCDAAASLEYRSMILIYLALDTPSFTGYDAHYFPSPEIPITRLSEPKNYGLNGSAGTTVLCAELPCTVDGDFWRASDEDLGRLVLDSLRSAGIPYAGGVLGVVTRRLAEAYPIYRRGFRRHFAVLDEWASSIDGLVTLGRQGLFAHDNTHHTLAMAYAAARAVTAGGGFLREVWARERETFQQFIVED